MSKKFTKPEQFIYTLIAVWLGGVNHKEPFLAKKHKADLDGENIYLPHFTFDVNTGRQCSMSLLGTLIPQALAVVEPKLKYETPFGILDFYIEQSLTDREEILFPLETIKLMQHNFYNILLLDMAYSGCFCASDMHINDRKRKFEKRLNKFMEILESYSRLGISNFKNLKLINSIQTDLINPAVEQYDE